MNEKLKDALLKYEKYKWQFWFVLGLLAVLLFLIPSYVLRENAYFMIHDELDDGGLFLLSLRFSGVFGKGCGQRVGVSGLEEDEILRDFT